ncbi:unnamed protein product [Sympodiomycopsis kandeliae]
MATPSKPSTSSSPPNLLALTLMGHVDHGKSSYADSLLASNGIISQRQAGKIRYLDSREDEQERGITIESSGVRLGFKMRGKPEVPGGEPGPVQEWTLNLIDTPGHIDFSSEVSTSSRLVDGCLILVDALEGVCTQTINVLRQAWVDRLKPILVLNKIDRLAVEVKMTAAEAEAQLQRVIEQANVTLASLWAEERLQDEDREREQVEARGETFVARGEDSSAQEEADAELYFDPARGNVIFASSLYGFAFRLHSFSHLYSKKLGLPEDKFRNFLWGDWYFDAKGKRMLNRKQAVKFWGENRLGSTACQQFVLENVWRVFEKTVLERDQSAMEKIVSTLSLPINPRDLKNPDSNVVLSSILSAWLPLAPCTFSTLVDQIPTPAVSQGRRVPRILDPLGKVWKSELSRFYADRTGLERPQGRSQVEKDLFAAQRGRNAWRVGVISKMFAVSQDDLPLDTNNATSDTANDKAQESSARDHKESSARDHRQDVRNMTIEERRQRARELRERQQAAKAEASQAEATNLAASGGVPEQDAAVPVQLPVAVSSEHTIAGSDNQAPANELGTGPAVAIDVTYQPPAPAETATKEADVATGKDKDEHAEVLLAFVRVYSGSLISTKTAEKSPYFLLLPKYNTSLPADHPSNQKHIKRVHITDLYVIMGKELVKVERAQAGEVCAVRGLEGVVGRMGTLVALPEAVTPSYHDEAQLLNQSSEGFLNLTSGAGLAAPIVRVALEPDNPTDLPKLIEGLRLLNQSDPCVQTLVQETGEHVIVTAGELHLERCLKDLRERFARVPISASEPLVPFRETAIRVSEMSPPKFGQEGDPRGTVHVSVGNGAVKIKLRAKPLPNIVTEWLEANTATIRTLLDRRGGSGAEEGDASEAGTTGAASSSTSQIVPPGQFFSALNAKLHKAGSTAKAWDQEWKEEDLVERIWAFGPRRVGPNIVIGPREGVAAGRGLKDRIAAMRAGQGSGIPTPAPERHSAGQRQQETEAGELEAALAKASLDDTAEEQGSGKKNGSGQSPSWSGKDLLDSLDSGFQMATLQGPMCAEPVRGMAYFIEEFIVDVEAAEKNHLRLSQISGSLISSMREGYRNGLLDWSPRLLLAMYECDIQSTPEVLGKVHGVLSRRRGKVLSEEMQDGTAYFTIKSSLPVIESFGFSDEIRKKTSGVASPQLIFKGFEIFNLDPYWIPRTVEELEDLGEKDERENIAKKFMDSVRKRKGMHVDSDRIVSGAEKQRNLKSN